ncbi:MAG: hypothetical protein ACLFQV_12170 [Vulcanimicrobiota bacterium]
MKEITSKQINYKSPLKQAKPEKIFCKPDEAEEKQVGVKDRFITQPVPQQKRIQIALDKAKMVGAEISGYTSMIVLGSSLGTSLAVAISGPAIIPIAICGGVGVLAGAASYATGIDKKVGEALKKGIDIALTPVAYVGRKIKNAFSKAIDLIKPDKNSSEGLKHTKESVSRHLSTAGETRNSRENLDKTERKEISSNEIASKLAGSLGTVAKAGRGVPNILYPQVIDASAAQKEVVYQVLDSLPASTATSTDRIFMAPDLEPLGRATALPAESLVELRKMPEVMGKGTPIETLIHEMGHTHDFASGPTPFINRSSFEPFGEGPYFYEAYEMGREAPYAAKNRFEDWAQSFEAYYAEPENLQAQCPEKFEAIKEFHESSVYDKVVEKTGIREAGKKLSEAIDAVPGLRTGINMARNAAGPITFRIGVEDYKKGLGKDNKAEKFSGKMNMAQGIAYSTKFLAPVGLGITAAKWLMGRRIKKGKLAVEKADKIASGFLAAMTGPLGMITLAASQVLTENGKKAQKDGHGQVPAKKDDIRLEYEDVHYDSNITPSVLNTGSRPERKSYKLTSDDKKLIAKVSTGALAGGVAGTAAGFTVGGLIGTTVGALIGGPVGASVLGLAGYAAGTLFGSYKGGKMGAKIGKYLGENNIETIRKSDAEQ